MRYKKTIRKGEIFIPSLLAKGMNVRVNNPIVIVATNKDGSVTGKPFAVAGILESVTGPGGRDGYIHIEDAAEVLRMPELEISEVAICLKDFNRLQSTFQELEKKLAMEFEKDGKFPRPWCFLGLFCGIIGRVIFSSYSEETMENNHAFMGKCLIYQH